MRYTHPNPIFPDASSGSVVATRTTEGVIPRFALVTRRCAEVVLRSADAMSRRSEPSWDQVGVLRAFVHVIADRVDPVRVCPDVIQVLRTWSGTGWT